jgi:hypothetical protein
MKKDRLWFIMCLYWNYHCTCSYPKLSFLIELYPYIMCEDFLFCFGYVHVKFNKVLKELRLCVLCLFKNDKNYTLSCTFQLNNCFSCWFMIFVELFFLILDKILNLWIYLILNCKYHTSLYEVIYSYSLVWLVLLA